MTASSVRRARWSTAVLARSLACTFASARPLMTLRAWRRRLRSGSQPAVWSPTDPTTLHSTAAIMTRATMVLSTAAPTTRTRAATMVLSTAATTTRTRTRTATTAPSTAAPTTRTRAATMVLSTAATTTRTRTRTATTTARTSEAATAAAGGFLALRYRRSRLATLSSSATVPVFTRMTCSARGTRCRRRACAWACGSPSSPSRTVVRSAASTTSSLAPRIRTWRTSRVSVVVPRPCHLMLSALLARVSECCSTRTALCALPASPCR
mmetsp:Transcript_15293/g.53129  ORF Transcript_15293/g.53129 Transcript_15293/m.53129 type:complete len:267 (-) Transcript_15293:3467-4267(-)